MSLVRTAGCGASGLRLEEGEYRVSYIRVQGLPGVPPWMWKLP